jgi:hypothetical protein
LDPLLLPLGDLLVQPLGISSEASERVEKPVLVAEADLLEVRVPIELRVLYLRVENLDAVTIQELDGGALLLHEVVHDAVGFVRVVPVLELEPAAALTGTLASRSPRAFIAVAFTAAIDAAAVETPDYALHGCAWGKLCVSFSQRLD